MPFRLLARADVADRRRHQDSLVAFQRAQHQLDRKLAAILPPPGEFEAHADLLRQRGLRGSKTVGEQPLGKAFRNDVSDFLTKELVAAVPELFFRLKIE